jgi:hypothetical protein
MNDDCITGIAHTLAIGFAVHRKPYMAKDIILLFPAAQEHGTREWLDAYFNTKPDSLPLDAHAGSIQAGLALEFPHETSLYNVYVDLSINERYIQYVVKSARTLLLNVLTLATGVSDGVHGQFLHYRIEMITLYGTLDKHHEYQSSPTTARAFDDVIEGIYMTIHPIL